MAKWVTFYHDVMSKCIRDYVEHPDRESATKHFENHYRDYFHLRTKTKVKLPMAYGFPFRKYIGMTLRSFEKEFGKVKGKGAKLS